jgi:hypothetical protein
MPMIQTSFNHMRELKHGDFHRKDKMEIIA